MGPGYYLGWRDGTVASGNQGVIAALYASGSDTVLSSGIRYFGTGGTFVPGTDFGAGTFYSRDYSVQAYAYTPEPGTLTLLALGGLSLWRRRRR